MSGQSDSERGARVKAAAKEIDDAQNDVGRTFDNSLTYKEIVAIIAKVEQSGFAAGWQARAESGRSAGDAKHHCADCGAAICEHAMRILKRREP